MSIVCSYFWDFEGTSFDGFLLKYFGKRFFIASVAALQLHVVHFAIPLMIHRSHSHNADLRRSNNTAYLLRINPFKMYKLDSKQRPHRPRVIDIQICRISLYYISNIVGTAKVRVTRQRMANH